MARADQYVMLICSLPAHPANLFKAQQTTLSRRRLDKRLKLLEPRHAKDLALVEEVLHWSRLPMGLADHEFLQRTQDVFKQVESAFVKELVGFRLEQRSLLALLRKRQLGHDGFTDDEVWGCRRWLSTIRRHWQHPDFGLKSAVPWLAEANQLLESGDIAGLQRQQMELNWSRYHRVAGGHIFDFEAVVIYVLRWDMIDRWVRYDGQAAQARFQALVDAGLGSFKSALP